MTPTIARATNDHLSPDFLDFIVSLNNARVDWVLVGGYALSIHGVIRATGDIDFLYRRTKANVHRLCIAMTQFGAPSTVIDPEVLLEPAMVTQFGAPPNRIDLLSEIDGVTFKEVWDHATEVVVEGQAIRVIGLDQLRKNKAATGRVKDREDARKLAAQVRKKRKR